MVFEVKAKVREVSQKAYLKIQKRSLRKKVSLKMQKTKPHKRQTQ